MGFKNRQWRFTERHLSNLLGGEYQGKKMLELGCQELKKSFLKKLIKTGKIKVEKDKPQAAKVFFEALGFKHISIDIEKCFSAIRLDLREPFPNNFENAFDVITNYGTTEHVWPYKHQYQCFKNIHNCAKVGGVFIHIVPVIGGWIGHSDIYYDNAFFIDLAKANSYKMVEMKNEKTDSELVLTTVCLVKTIDVPFNSNKKDFFKHIINIKNATKL